tara:strand:- start:4265 stop:4558 length:294 start_codon:yes stop_codon:yes gene_type:complete
MKNEIDQSSFERIAQRIRWLRMDKGLSQIEFAESINVSKTTYNNWETAKQQLSIDGAKKINATYLTSLDFLYLGRSDTLPNHLLKSWLEYDKVNNSR